MIKFPAGFYWGAATSAYQVEGNNKNSDWWEWEKRAGKQPSGDACGHYRLYQEDFGLARALNHNAHRLSIEWARIEPQEGKFSEAEIEHYKQVIACLRQQNIEPVVTLHHFSNPVWFADSGGWKNPSAPDFFLRYVEKIVEALSEKVHFWVTINEPMVYVYHAYILGAWPPQEKSSLEAKKAIHNLVLAHVKAYRAIHALYKRKNLKPPAVSIAKNIQAFAAAVPTLRNRVAAYLRHNSFNLAFLNSLMRHKALDFIGINYYTRGLVNVESWLIQVLLFDESKAKESGLQKNSLGWDIYPAGLYQLLLKFKKYRLPLFILENGICTDDDNLRWEFICGHLASLYLAMQKGVRVLGYLYWSLLDNFEWDKGFAPRFGLIEVDYANFKRTIRESARKFSQVCRTGLLNV
ncbi:MAG: glycoside hydrolase family 1 protein [Candidatus Omnitrophota bacterium]|nr:glycoside hydrolase family 1 protein [Candidatus Omnitrophota bacterium]